MSYLFQSRQLHPRNCSLGMGIVGPDQPWTSATANKVIAEREQQCPSGDKLRRLSEFATPKTEVGGEVVEDQSCFKTGKVWEAKKAGNPRGVEWCCPVNEALPPRALTQSDHELWKDRCGPMRSPSGTIYETIPQWRDANKYVGSTCERTHIYDEGYELVCCPPPHQGAYTLPEQTFVVGTPTAEQEAAWEAERQEAQLDRERQVQEAALPAPTFVERYGFAMLMVAGTVGIGVTAALFKRFSVAAKKAEEAKAAVSSLQQNPSDGHGLETIEIDDGSFEVYYRCPYSNRSDFLGVVDDSGLGDGRFMAMSRRNKVTSHRHLDDAAKWLAQEMFVAANGGR